MDPLADEILALYRNGVDKPTAIRNLLAAGRSVADINAAMNAIEARGKSSVPLSPVPPPAAAMPQPPPPPAFTIATSPVPPPPVTPPAHPVPQPPAPPPAPPPPTAFSTLPPPKRSPVSLALIIGVLAVLSLAGIAYAYVAKLGPFSHPPYTAANFVTGMLASAATIQTATYKAELSMSVGPRDAGALPYVAPAGPDAATVAKYARDATRGKDISGILLSLDFAAATSRTFPASLGSMRKVGAFSLTDPSGKPYAYARTAGGKNFTLSATFETPEAIKTVESTRVFSATSTTVAGQTVTFGKGSFSALNLSSTPPKPFFEQLADDVRAVPAQLSVEGSLGGTTDFTSPHPDWTFNIAGSGDFGDLSYAVDVDLLKKGSIYYFRINKMPSLFLTPFNLEKGQWVEVDPAASSTKSAASLFSLSAALPSAESSYKDWRSEVVAFLAAEAQIADRDGLIAFKSAPVADTVDGRHLYRYDVRFAKDALATFTKDARAELASGKYPMLASYASPDNSSAFSGPSFDAAYAYYDANTTFTVWVDAAGHPAIIRYTIRVVPPADATQLAGKQVNIAMTLSLSGINVPVSIEAPQGAVPLDTLLKAAQQPSTAAR